MLCSDDAEIIRRLKQPGSRNDACRALRDKYGRSLLGFLAKRCDGDVNRADELLLDTYLKAVKYLASSKQSPDNLKTWLFTIAINVKRDADRVDRAIASKLSTQPMVDGDEDAASFSAWGMPDHDDTVSGDRNEAVRATMSRLGNRHRELLELEYTAQSSRAEIASITGIRQQSLSQYILRAKDQFLKIAIEYPPLASLKEDR